MRVVCVKSYRNCRHRLFSFVSPEESCDAADKTSPRRHSSINSNVVHLLDRFRTKTVKVRLRYFDFWMSCSCVWGSNQVSVDSGADDQNFRELHYLWRTEKKTPTFKMDLFLKPSGCRCLLNVSHKKKKLFYINTLQRSDVNPSNIHSAPQSHLIWTWRCWTASLLSSLIHVQQVRVFIVKCWRFV